MKIRSIWLLIPVLIGVLGACYGAAPVSPVIAPGPSNDVTALEARVAQLELFLSTHGNGTAPPSGHRVGFTPVAGSVGQVQVAGNNGEPTASSHFTALSNGAVSVAPDGTGFLTIGGTTMPASGDVRWKDGLTVRGSDGAADHTLFSWAAGANNLFIGTDVDNVSHQVGEVNCYPSGVVALGINNITYLYMQSAAQQVQIYGNTTLQIGTAVFNPATTGLIQVPNNLPILNARNAANSADIPILTTDASDDVIVGDTTQALNTLVRGASIAGLQPGSAFLQQASTGIISASQSSASMTGTTNGQMLFDTQSRPVCADAQGNDALQMAIFNAVLAGNASTTNTTPTNTNLTFKLGATDAFTVEVEGWLETTGSSGMKVGFSGPTGSTYNGFYVVGGSSSANAVTSAVAGSTLPVMSSVALGTSASSPVWFRTRMEVQGDGTHGGSVTFQFEAVSSGTAEIVVGTGMRAIQAIKL